MKPTLAGFVQVVGGGAAANPTPVITQ
jgi:hypothetical protein